MESGNYETISHCRVRGGCRQHNIAKRRPLKNKRGGGLNILGKCECRFTWSEVEQLRRMQGREVEVAGMGVMVRVGVGGGGGGGWLEHMMSQRADGSK